MNNDAENHGGGIHASLTTVRVTSSRFDQNHAVEKGGGMFVEKSKLSNCVSNKPLLNHLPPACTNFCFLNTNLDN